MSRRAINAARALTEHPEWRTETPAEREQTPEEIIAELRAENGSLRGRIVVLEAQVADRACRPPTQDEIIQGLATLLAQGVNTPKVPRRKSAS